LSLANWLYSFGGFTTRALHNAFRAACWGGHLDVAEWLYSIGKINSRFDDDECFQGATGEGHLSILQFLYYECGVRLHSDDAAFYCACSFDHLNVAKWFYTLGEIDLHGTNKYYAIRQAFVKPMRKVMYPLLNGWRV
jgi:hypothetical protein